MTNLNTTGILDNLPEPAAHVAAAMTPEDKEREKLRKMEAAIPNMPPRDQDFARSMIEQYRNRGFLSPRQWPWVDKLTERATRTRTSIGLSLPRLAELFKVAGTHLKRPHIGFEDTPIGPVHLKVAGPNARVPGSVNVSNSPRFGGTWYGRILPDGTFEQSKDCTPAVVKFLTTFAQDPADFAARHGIRTGRCCFCRQTLTDPRSTKRGYGPVCAGHYGLPWG